VNSEQGDDPLNGLTADERLVLTEICNAFLKESQRSLSAREIGERCNISEGEARRRLSNIYKKLHINGSDQDKRIRLIFRYCIDREEPLEDKQQTNEVPQREEQDKTDEEIRGQLEELGRRRVMTDSPPRPRTRWDDIWNRIVGRVDDARIWNRIRGWLDNASGWEINWQWVAIFGVVFTVGLVLAILLPRLDLGRQPPPTSLAEGPGTMVPTAGLAQISPQDTLAASTRLPTEEATPTSSNTPTPTSTFTPTFTSTPTLSPTPAATDTPESGEPTVLHSDNFQKGLDEQWDKLYGNASIVSGILTTDDNVMLTVGDSNWINYDITLKSTASKDMHYCTDTLEHDYVAFRMQDRNNFYAFSWGRCGTAWYIVENGDWSMVPESYVQDLIQKNDHEIEIDIEGNFFQAYVDGNPQANFYDDRYTSGGLGLRIDKFVTVDDWLVKALP
jgi:hypothetical protein